MLPGIAAYFVGEESAVPPAVPAGVVFGWLFVWAVGGAVPPRRQACVRGHRLRRLGQNSRAMALLRLGRLAAARAAVERALAVPAADAEAWARCYFLTTRAAINVVSGATEAALDGYREALRQPGIAGTDAQARAMAQLALTLLVAGDADAAERLLHEPVEREDLAVRLERRFAEGVHALVRGDRAEATAAARELERRALPTYPAYRTAAGALLAAADASGPVDVAAVVARLFTAPG